MKASFLIAALLACAHATAANAAASPPYATIRWADKMNPRLINAGGDRFIVATRAGIQVWDAMANKLAPGTGWPTHTALDDEWARLAGGTVMTGSSHDARDIELHTLVWWDPASGTFPARLQLPAGTLVADLVAIDRQHALACLRHFDPSKPRPDEIAPGSARLLTLEKGVLRWSEPGVAATRQAMLAAGVRGKVTGEGTLALEGDAAPLAYDTASCGWVMRQLPAALAKMTRISVKPQRLPDGRFIVAHADWFDPEKQTSGTLAAPYLWDAAAKRWQQLNGPGAAPGSSLLLSSVDIDDPVVSLAGDDIDYVEVLDPVSLRWRRFNPALLRKFFTVRAVPLSNGDVVVFMGMDGAVYRARPAHPLQPGELAYPHWYLGEVALPGHGLMLLNGGNQWHPQNKPEIVHISTQAAAAPIAPMPRWLGSNAGVALRDGTVLVFGGLLPGCAGGTSDPGHCTNQPVPPALRYFPAHDRWEEEPGLRIPHARGAPWGTDSDFTNDSARADVQVRSDGRLIAVLDAEGDAGSVEPLLSKVLGWRPGEETVALPPLQRGRQQSTLLELDGGRMAVVGGQSQPVRIALEPKCAACADEFVSYGPVGASRLTETLDAQLREWTPGPKAHFGGGRAVRLANGRIFKMSLPDESDSRKGLRAETADAAFTRWTPLPPFPKVGFAVQHMVAIGNRVLILGQDGHTVIWDDLTAKWEVLWGWQGAEVYSASEGPGGKVLLRYRDRVALVPMPGKENK